MLYKKVQNISKETKGNDKRYKGCEGKNMIYTTRMESVGNKNFESKYKMVHNAIDTK